MSHNHAAHDRLERFLEDCTAALQQAPVERALRELVGAGPAALEKATRR